MEDVYKSLMDDLARFIETEDNNMCLIVLLAMQEVRLFINYSKEAWEEEEVRNMLHSMAADLQLQDA